MMADANSKRGSTTLWIGGSSSLARSYINKFGDNGLLLSGVEDHLPTWIQNANKYIPCNLTKVTETTAREIFEKHNDVETIIIGVRPLLFAAKVKSNKNGSDQMLEGISTLLKHAVSTTRNLRYVLHISSVAAADHLKAQRFVNETDLVPTLSELQAPYDIFKRKSEVIIETICRKENISFSHLRLSAIFSDDKDCIQCSAMEMQRWVGCYYPWAIDCNSSHNVSEAIRAMIVRATKDTSDNNPILPPLQPLYYYTRPLMLPKPVPYGYYIEMFREAHGIKNSSIWIPMGILTLITWFVNLLARSWNRHFNFEFPYLNAADYLLQVASREHSFDCSRFATDFPGLKEESILECFSRRKILLATNNKSKLS